MLVKSSIKCNCNGSEASFVCVTSINSINLGDDSNHLKAESLEPEVKSPTKFSQHLNTASVIQDAMSVLAA